MTFEPRKEEPGLGPIDTGRRDNASNQQARRVATGSLADEDTSGSTLDSATVESFFNAARMGDLGSDGSAQLYSPFLPARRGSTTGQNYQPTPWPGRNENWRDRRDRGAYSGRKKASISQIFEELYKLDEDELIALQQSLLEAGLVEGGRVSWGRVDTATRAAVVTLATEAAADPSKDMFSVLNKMIRTNGVTDNEVLAALGETDMEAAHKANMAQTLKPIQVSDPNVLRGIADDVGQKLLGRDLTPQEREAVFGIVQGKERDLAHRQQAYDLKSQDYQSAVAITAQGPKSTENAPGDLSTGAAQVDQFMNAIAVGESGGDYGAYNAGSGATGKYQILSKYWSAWAVESGLPANAPMTPQNQDRVARYKMLKYYKQYGNWRDVAIAWYGGAGGVKKAHAGGGYAKEGSYPSIQKYADDVVARMGSGGTPNADAQGVVAGGPPAPFEYSDVDPDAEAAAYVRRTDPKGWGGNRFAQEAAEFSQLISGLPGPS